MLHIDEIAVAASESMALPLRLAQSTRAARVLIVPGWRDSGADHWQTHWQDRLGAQRVQQPDWESPRCADWVAGLDHAARAQPGPVILVAHSLGCVTIAHWVLQAGRAEHVRAFVRGALLVAPADVERPDAPEPLLDFAPVPRVRLPFPALVVASSNDPYCSFDRAARFARDWGAGLFSLGDAGHVNAASGHQRWIEGLSLMQPFDGWPVAESC